MAVIKVILDRKKIVVSIVFSRDEFNYMSVKTTTVLVFILCLKFFLELCAKFTYKFYFLFIFLKISSIIYSY